MPQKDLKPRRGPGQPTACTPQVVNAIISAVRAGNYHKDAAEYAGISNSAATKWGTRGRAALADAGFDLDTDEYDMVGDNEDIPPHIASKIPESEQRYVQYVLRLRKAEATSTVRFVSQIAADKSWQAKAWLLERRRPEQWGRRRLEITGADGGPIQVQAVRDALIEKVSRYDQPAVIDVKLGGTPHVELPSPTTNGDHT